MMEYNIHTLLNSFEERFGDRGYIYEKANGIYAEKTCRQFAEDVRRFAMYLLSKGYGKSNILLYGANSYNYMVADVAIMGYTGISVTVSKEWKKYDLCNAIRSTDIKAVIYDAERADIIAEVKEVCRDVEYIPMETVSCVLSEKTTLVPTDNKQCLKIVFSSGTTGVPKAVMLSGKNMFANWEGVYKRAPFNCDDICYLFLPLSHTYGGLCNFLYSLISGMRIYLCSDTKKIFEELREVKPTFFCAVPLIYERMCKACITHDISPKEILGGNIKHLFCGGAPLKSEIREYIKADGVNFLEAYGLSETASLISADYPGSDNSGAVGTILENITLKIDSPDAAGAGEILVRGDNVFSGYYNRDNSDVFDSEGFFRTGDIGYVREGRLYLVGRAKRMILLSNGENVYPDDVEALFSGYEAIAKVKVYEKDKTVFASLYVNEPIDAEAIIRSVNSRLPKYSYINGYEVIKDSIDTRMK